MMMRSYDLSILLKAIEPYKDRWPIDDFKTWISLPYNVMLTDGKNVGLATYEYPGMYSVHWYLVARGREVINLGLYMAEEMFTTYGAETLRAFVADDLRSSKWACRQVGFKSLGKIKYPNKTDDELFYLNKREFFQKKELDNG